MKIVHKVLLGLCILLYHNIERPPVIHVPCTFFSSRNTGRAVGDRNAGEKSKGQILA